MNPEAKEKWVKALRSGKYLQTQGRLSNGEGFCCLGVLCVVAEMGSVFIRRDVDDSSIYGHGISSQPFVSQWAQVDAHAQDHLVSMNDDDHRSFEEIAHHIEENL